MSEFIIYGLRDPRTDEYKYIGKSSSGIKRARSHLTYSHNDSVNIWVRELHTEGYTPSIDILQKCEKDELQTKEKFWIHFYESAGCKLFNHAKYRGHIFEGIQKELDFEYALLQKKLTRVRETSAELDTIGGFIKNRRKELKISSADLAEIAGISQNSLTKIEGNKINYTIKTLSACLDVLGYDLVPVLKFTQKSNTPVRI